MKRLFYILSFIFLLFPQVKASNNIWALAEVAGAVSDMAVNTQAIDTNSNLGKAVNAYNLAMGIIGLKNIGKGIVNFAKNLPEQTRSLLQENKGLRDLLVTKYVDWKVATTNLSDAEKQLPLITQEEQVWKALGVADEDLAALNGVKNASKLVTQLNLGSFLKKIGDYEVYENGEVFYRAMTHAEYDLLLSTGKLPATSETFTSPTLEYIKAVGYGDDGVIVKFQMKHGTLDKLESIGVRNDETPRLMKYYPDMPEVKSVSNWTQNNALFKTEGGKYKLEQINIGLGKGKALNEFNNNIIDFEIIK